MLGIAVSLGCLYFATRGTDWSDVGGVMANASPGWLAACVLASLAAVYVRAQRWRILLRPVGDVGLYPALSATAIGFGASSVLPFRAGEIVRPALLGRSTGVGISAAFSSVVLERLFDVLLVIGCFVAVSLVYTEVPAGFRRGAYALAAAAAVGFIVLVVIQRHRSAAEAIIDRVLAWLPGALERPLRPLIGSFLHGLGGLADLPTVLLVLGYSVYLWGIIMLTFLFSFLALNVPVPLVAASLTTVVIVAAAVFLPQAPGFIGTWQAGCVLALGLFGVSKDVAVGYSLLTWLLQMAINIGMAGIFLAREDLSLGQLLRIGARETPPAGAEG